MRISAFSCELPSAVSEHRSVLDEAESFRIVLLFLVAHTLISLLLSAHDRHHVDKIARHHISLLLLCSERTLSTLQTLLLVLLKALGFFRVFAHRTLISVTEEYALLLRRHIGCLFHHFTLFLNQNTRDGLVDPLGRLSLIIFVLRVLKAEQLFALAHHEIAVCLLELVLLLLDSVASVLDVGNQPIVFVRRPLSACLNLHVLDGRDELIDDQVLESDLTGQFTDAVHEVLTLTMDDFTNVIKLVLSHDVARLHTLCLSVDFLKLFLLRGEVLAQF